MPAARLQSAPTHPKTVGAVSNRADLTNPVGVVSNRASEAARLQRAYPTKTVGAVSNRASLARDRPSPYDKGQGYRSAGACPPRTSAKSEHGEGQALALRH